MKVLIIFFTLTIIISACGPYTSSNKASSSTANYYMAFQSCNTSTLDCSSNANQTINLASSPDGSSWSLVSSFTSFAGYDPELLSFDGFLYLFYSDSNTGKLYYNKYNSSMTIKETSASTFAGDDFGMASASIIYENSKFYAFYLPINLNGSKNCSGYPCTRSINSAQGTGLTSFSKMTNARASTIISSGDFYHPKIIKLASNNFVLYVGNDQHTVVFQSSTIDGAYNIPNGGPSLNYMSFNNGGNPTAVVSSDNILFLYTNLNSNGISYIQIGKSTDGISLINSFTKVIDNTISSIFNSNTTITNPSVEVKPSTW